MWGNKSWLWHLGILAALPGCGEVSNERDLMHTRQTASTQSFPSTTAEPESREGTASGNQATLASIVFADDINQVQVSSFKRDLAIIAKFDASFAPEDDSAMKTIMGLSDLGPRALTAWLTTRLKYIVSSDDSHYPLEIIYPGLKEIESISMEEREQHASVAASNLGAEYFIIAYELSNSEAPDQYVRLSINGKWVSVVSPRVGLMKIGPGLFNMVPSDVSLSSFADSALRIEVLFHESRHSDGSVQHGSLGFTHILCPAQPLIPPELVGQPACDDSSNGAYSVSKVMSKAYWKKCENCSPQDKMVLEATYLDMVSRLVTVSGTKAPAKNDSPEPGFSSVDVSTFTKK